MSHRRTRFHLAPPSQVPLAVAVALVALAIATAGWAMVMQSRIGDRDERISALVQEVALLRQQANATSYALSPSADAPPNANGQAFFALNGEGVIAVANLPPAPEGRAYQVWYYPQPEAEPFPGATFQVDETGSGFMLIPADVGLFTNVSITLEPEAGVTIPSGPVMLAGETGGARG